jgi:hypothetical protein
LNPFAGGNRQHFVHVGLDTMGGFGCGAVAATAAYRSAKAAVNEVYDQA